ncbi:MAG: hypothetical protein Q9170_005533 [Blastenia crenularia]
MAEVAILEPKSYVSRLELLPAEILLKIIHYTMPQGGIVPRFPRNLQGGWADDEDETWLKSETRLFGTYLRNLQRAGSEYEAVPLSLFQVSKVIAGMTQSVFDDEVPFVIDITPLSMHFLGKFDSRSLGHMDYRYRNCKGLTHIQHFVRMHNFKLDFNFGPRWWARDLRKQLYPNSEIWWAGPKEHLRAICDNLMANSGIHRLTVRVPCLCSLKTANLASQAEIILLDLLSPLRRLRVFDTVQFDWKHDLSGSRLEDHGLVDERSHVCTHGLGETVMEVLRTKLGRLDGEELDHREKTWRAIKARKRAKSDLKNPASLKVSEALSDVHECMTYFLHSEAFDASIPEIAKSYEDDYPDSEGEIAFDPGPWNPNQIYVPLDEFDRRTMQTFDYFAREAVNTLKRAEKDRVNWRFDDTRGWVR